MIDLIDCIRDAIACRQTGHLQCANESANPFLRDILGGFEIWGGGHPASLSEGGASLAFPSPADECRVMNSQGHPILVVEDEPDIRDLMVTLLESEGYAVRAASHGAEALARLEEGPVPCLILLDLMMPVMDGWAFCQESQKNPLLAAIPIVVVSAVSRQDPRNVCVRAVEHLPKPIDIGTLLAAVERFC